MSKVTEHDVKMGREEALELAIAKIERQFGKGTIMKLGENAAKMQIDIISTGSIALDVALGIGGLPRGRISEIYGPEGSGKTTLALQTLAEAQKQGGIAAFIDVEHALDPVYAQNLGIDIENLYISQPDTGEQALEVLEALIRSNAVDIVVVDSVAALVPRAELEGEMGDAHMALQARLMSQALRKITAAINRSKTAAIFINQIREKVGVMFGSPEITPGGRALKFYSSIRIEVRKGDAIKIGTDTIGSRVKAKVVKNKLAPPFRQAEFDIIYGKGISKEGSLIDLAIELKVIEKSGSWFNFENEKIGQGRENAKVYLIERPEMMDEIQKKVYEKLGWATDNEQGRKNVKKELEPKL